MVTLGTRTITITASGLLLQTPLANPLFRTSDSTRKMPLHVIYTLAYRQRIYRLAEAMVFFMILGTTWPSRTQAPRALGREMEFPVTI